MIVIGLKDVLNVMYVIIIGVSDILRITTQIITKEQQEAFNKKNQRDIRRTVVTYPGNRNKMFAPMFAKNRKQNNSPV